MMDWFVFFLVMGNILINAIVLNSNIKHAHDLRLFHRAADLYVNAYREMVVKYNEVAEAFNSAKEVTDNQAEFLEAIIFGLTPMPDLSPEAVERLAEARQRILARLADLPNSPDTAPTQG